MADKPNEVLDEMTPEEQQQAVAVGRLFVALSKDPTSRPAVLKLLKKANPSIPIPELDFQDTLSKEFETRGKTLTEELKKRDERIENLERVLSRDQFRAENNLTEEELVEVENLNKEYLEKTPRSKIALDIMRQKQALGTPRGTRRSLPGTKEYLEKLAQINPNNVRMLKREALEEAERILSTARTG
jgi:hypothetical protein